MTTVELVSRAWAPGTDFPEPTELNWLYHLGLAVICILWTLSLLAVSLRLWARWTSKQIGIDDYLMLAAMAVNTGWFYTLVMYVKTCYAGIHYWTVPTLTRDQQATAKLYEWLIILLYHPILGFVKASVLSFDQKFIGTRKNLLYTVYALQAVNAGSMISVFCVTLFQCNPMSLNWTPGYRRTCINNVAFNYAYNCIVIATDVAVLAVPFWAFINLQMRRRLKIALLGVFALGGLVTIISCVRLALLISWFDQFYKGLGSKDLYYSFGWAVSPIECNLAIIAASIPALWPLFRKAFPGFYSDMNYSYRVNTQPSGSNTHGGTGHRSNQASAFRSNLARPMGASHVDDDDDADDTYMMKTMHANGQADCRATTPTSSQDGIMDVKNGIIRTTDVQIGYEDATKSRDFVNDREEYPRNKVAYAL
ncbi:CFEM domain-containing protein [Colletotrichum sojae]|uniref:CFEM domain-containing protein n=1 Tax=Colletotrichum sojae TaxID=2175907 RepID=A0A8H6IN53_9PEZI|nr:CFEM domain-containing protein [Colletotrichum sojae]